jgi:hypothetical protein
MKTAFPRDHGGVTPKATAQSARSDVMSDEIGWEQSNRPRLAA